MVNVSIFSIKAPKGDSPLAKMLIFMVKVHCKLSRLSSTAMLLKTS